MAANSFRTGQTPVGAVAAKIQVPKLPDGNKVGVLVKAYGEGDDPPNTVPVFLGDAQVTINSGFPLGPGESVTIPISGDDIWAVASINDQRVAWVVA